MVLRPLLRNYNINVLVELGNRTIDEFNREQIKLLIAEKIYVLDYSMFYLINKYKNANMILKEVYAKLIIMKLREDEYYIDDIILDEILEMVSFDDLIYYGREAASFEIREKSIKKFYDRGMKIEDKNELYKKINYERIMKKRKVINNDKY